MSVYEILKIAKRVIQKKIYQNREEYSLKFFGK